jgi:aspartyl-tRNA(Asn)/glutamyl-tRNA(Gln) amidotransferase subunit C
MSIIKAMSIDISHIAKLANLTLTEEEEKKFAKQLSDTLEAISTLRAIDTTTVSPTNNVTGLENIVREDTAAPSLPQEDALKNASSTHNGLFTVTAIFEQEEK